MQIKAKDILRQIAIDLNDRTSTRWTMQDLTTYFNEGQRQILVYRPDALDRRIDLALVAGHIQHIPEDGEKFIALNANTEGGKRSITPISLALLDANVPQWRARAQKDEVLHYMFDVREPKTFMVYPPVNAGVKVNLEYAAVPTDITVMAQGDTWEDVPTTDVLGLSPLFESALVAWIKYRSFAKQTELMNPDLAAAYYKMFGSELGLELEATKGVASTNAASKQ